MSGDENKDQSLASWLRLRERERLQEQALGAECLRTGRERPDRSYMRVVVDTKKEAT